jgi:hypothetical protein
MSRISSLAWLAGSVLMGAQSLGAPELAAQSLDSAAVAGMRWRVPPPRASLLPPAFLLLPLWPLLAVPMAMLAPSLWDTVQTGEM